MRFALTAVLLACAAALAAATPAPAPEPAILDRGDGGDPGSF